MPALLAPLIHAAAAWRDRRRLRRHIRRLRAFERRSGLQVLAVALAGKYGKVMIGANVVAEIDEWDYTPSSELQDKTAFPATSRTHLMGLMAGSGSFKGRHDQTDTNGQVAIRNAMIAGTQLTLLLYVSATHFYTVPAMLKSMPLKVNVAGLAEVQFDFERDGDDTYT